ncbi:DEAD/DEAH box helicase [Aeromonas caviae]|uniref:DEAD/DEAH box helicase n=1 Tax=Aeromonas caviae TaxID=648 RepID=UPI002B461A28|nr:ATP-binding domain-containing protein [Aeromonas caviae]
MSKLSFIRGSNGKPVATRALEDVLASINSLEGECFFGYPLIPTPEGKFFLDGTYLSCTKGIVLFDIVEGTNLGNYKERQDDLANKIESKLRLHRELLNGRRLIPPISVVTYAPALTNLSAYNDADYHVANDSNLDAILGSITWSDSSDALFKATVSAIESLSSIRKSRLRREVHNAASRGSLLKNLEDSIATLDHRQNRAVVETVDGVQRIRGLAGSGKTIVLALKAAYLHTQHPDWRIAVTFNTRSLKGQFKRLINNFCVEQSGEEPDWTKLRVINAWGAPGGDERDGLYYEACRVSASDFFDFRAAKAAFGDNEKSFRGACEHLLSTLQTSVEVYDAILVDEAQDFSPSFLKLCYTMLRDPKRLVYAYDELQNLSGTSLPPPEEIFGENEKGIPLVSLAMDERTDVILQKCYRNSRPVLVAAHALGFGIYREPPPKTLQTGLVQMFEQPALWQEIGYRAESGDLEKGKHVVLQRTPETSPEFLENHSPIDDIIQFIRFENEHDQNEWVAKQIHQNITQDELRHDDIIVINPDPLSARAKVGPIRKILFDNNIQSHLAGVDTEADVFFRSEWPSVTFTGIYRAKGNESGMVYIINAQDCHGYGAGLSTLRSRLFTAITRSKAWVRIVGHGHGMDALMSEYQKLRDHNFMLDFTYPTDDILKTLRIVHRDISAHEKKRLEQKKNSAVDFVEALKNGELTLADLDEATKEALIAHIRDMGAQ